MHFPVALLCLGSVRSALAFTSVTRMTPHTPSVRAMAQGVRPRMHMVALPLEHAPRRSKDITEKYSSEPLPSAKEIKTWRLAALALVGAVCLKAPAINALLAKSWSFLQTQAWFRHDMFEPCVAVGSFFIWIHGWLLMDVLALRGFLPHLRRYRLQDQAYAPTQSGATPNRWYAGWPFEMAVYLLPLWAISHFTDWFAPRRAALALGAPSIFRVVWEIMGGLFLYDALFWLSHVALHRGPGPLYRRLHGKHHINREVRASDTVRLTMAEETTDVVCSIAALRILKAHPLSRSLYNMVITFLLVELHCGYDFAWSPQNLLPGGLMAGSRRHHEHHRSGRVFYQKFFTWLDEAFGFGESPSLFRRATNGLSRLSSRQQ
jgi:sterol desaturase/sphingolipid hydroxylase (fatty acid hydroxylase superfamily)